MTLEPGFVLENTYRIERLIGEGAFGAVYRAQDMRLARPVAIKELHRVGPQIGDSLFLQYEERFNREIQIQSQLQHRNIVQVYCFYKLHDAMYLVLEYVDGPNLHDYLTQYRILPPYKAVRLTQELLDALAHVHSHRLDIVHRDIKPSNILMTRDGHAKLADFGLAQMAAESTRSDLGNRRHPGTPLYMAPEQEQTYGYLRPSADLYSLGCVLFEMLTGELWKRQLPTIKPSDISPEVPEWLDKVVKKALEEDPHARFRSAQEMQDALQKQAVWPSLEQVAGNLGLFRSNPTAENATTIVEELANALSVPILRQKTEAGFTCYWIDVAEAYSGINLPVELPILLYSQETLSDIESKSLQEFLDNASVHSQIVVILHVSEMQQARSRQPLGRLQQVYARDFVSLDPPSLLRVLASRHPRETFKSLIVAQADLRTVMPYVTTGPVSGKVFFGREMEIREVIEHASIKSYAIIGGRRVGKSSLLSQLHRYRLPEVGFVTVYHDCSTTPTKDVFLATSVTNWSSAKGVSKITFGELFSGKRISMRLYDKGFFRTISSLIRGNGVPSQERPLLILLDEADKIVSSDGQDNWRLFNLLRSVIHSGEAQVILSGERILQSALRDPSGPLFNLVNELPLGPLEFGAVEELITRPLKDLTIRIENEKEVIQQIFRFTSGHPNIVQRLCRRLIEHLNEQGRRSISLDDVKAITEDPGFQRDDFLSTYWEAATSLERIISLLMSVDPNTCTLPTIRQALGEHCNLHPKAREVDNALQRLVDLRSILKRTPTGYEFAVEAFPRVVAGTMTMNDMLEIFTEEYQEQGE